MSFAFIDYSLAYALNTPKGEQSRLFPSTTENLAETVKPAQHNLETSRDRSNLRCAAIRSVVVWFIKELQAAVAAPPRKQHLHDWPCD